MTDPSASGLRAPGLLALLLGAAVYPVTVAFRPPGEPGIWALAVAVLAALAGGAGAIRRASDTTRWRLLAVLTLVGGGAGVLLQALFRMLSATPVDASILGGAMLLAAGVVAGSWEAGQRLAGRMEDAVQQTTPAGHVQPVGHALLAGGCVALGAAGWARWDAPAFGWESVTVGLAVLLYTGVALLCFQRLRRIALFSGWQRSGRGVDPEIRRSWGAWASLFLVAAVGLVVVWWLPPAEPVRHAAQEASPEAVTWLRAYIDEHRMTREDLARPGAVAGESLPGGHASPPDEDRRIVTVRELFEWLLQPALEFGDVAPLPDEAPPRSWGVTPQLLVAVALLSGTLLGGYLWLRRATGRSPLRFLSEWWSRLWAALAAMLRRRPREYLPPEPVDRRRVHPGPDTSRARRWRRPATAREQVKYDYFRVLERAGQQGLPRRPAQSPRAYAEALAPVLPEHAGDIEELTVHFVEARYSHHPVPTTTAERTRAASRTLRRALKSHTPADRN